jgi:hypothetical protein
MKVQTAKVEKERIPSSVSVSIGKLEDIPPSRSRVVSGINLKSRGFDGSLRGQRAFPDFPFTRSPSYCVPQNARIPVKWRKTRGTSI